jgi:peptidyl-dipeptidase Dcp
MFCRGIFWLQHAIIFTLVFSSSMMAQPTKSPSTTDAKQFLSGDPGLSAENPFAQVSKLPFGAPDFRQIRHEHYLPAFEAGMRQQLMQIERIANQSEPATFENTLTAMELSGEILTRVERVFGNLTSSNTDESLQKIQAEIAPKRAAHNDNIYLNRKLYERVKHLFEHRDQWSLDPEQKQLVKEQYENFVRAGANLSDEDQQRIRKINEELSSLSTKFQENLLAITKEVAVLVSDVAELEGMSEGDIAAAAQAAEGRGENGKYLLAITNTTRQPILTSLKNRGLRQRVWEASANRGLGRDGQINNTPLVLQIAKLRAERAKILGFLSHAAYVLQNQMAEDPKAAFSMLTDLIPAVVQKNKEESQALMDVMKSAGESFELQPWDWEYYAEKVRQTKYDVDEAQVKPYFLLDNVLKDGVFFTMGKLYGITFKERHDLPIYHPDVRVFDVLDTDGKPLGLFYADYFARDAKRGGAWMNSFVEQSRLLNERPVIVNVMNIPKPAPGEPALISFDHTTTMFHEMGHALHGMFSSVEYPTLAGTSVPRDFVEFPSTFNEDWAIHSDVLPNYAKHYKTGETIPAELLKRVVAANKFNQGFDTLEYTAAALLDLEWHSLTPDQIPENVEAFEKQALRKHGIDLATVPPRYRTQFFAHVWSGGYSASYYAYLWSEVLAADAYAHLQTIGGLSRANGDAFRRTILSRGGSQEPMDMYQAFRGQKPTVDALLIRRGLK